MWPCSPGPPAITGLEILAAASPEAGGSSRRLICDPPEDAVADALRRDESAFVEALQRISDLPLDVDEVGAIGWIKPVVDHHRPDEVGCADRRTGPAKRIEHTARQTSWFEPQISLADPLRRDRLRLHCRSKQTDGRIQMSQIGAKLAELLLCSGDHAGNLGPLVGQPRHDMTFRHIHPRSRNDRGDYRRQADTMSARRLVCLRHDTAVFPHPAFTKTFSLERQRRRTSRQGRRTRTCSTAAHPPAGGTSEPSLPPVASSHSTSILDRGCPGLSLKELSTSTTLLISSPVPLRPSSPTAFPGTLCRHSLVARLSPHLWYYSVVRRLLEHRFPLRFRL